MPTFSHRQNSRCGCTKTASSPVACGPASIIHLRFARTDRTVYEAFCSTYYHSSAGFESV
jgi:hypothetical protein